MSKKNPIIGVYKGKPYRSCNRIIIKVGEALFKQLIDEVDRTGFSIPKVLAYSSKPCSMCKDVMVVVFDKNGIEQKVKRGILSKHIPQSSGINIIKQANAKRVKTEDQ